MKMETCTRRGPLAAAIACVLAPLSATAQDALEEITVTARRTVESLQEAPIAVSAFSAAPLEEQQLDGAYDLQNAVPNLVFSGGTGSTPNFNIRGVGSANGIGSTGDSGVLPHHNNVPLTGACPSSATLGRRIGSTLLEPRSAPASTPDDGSATTRAPAARACRRTRSCTRASFADARTTNAPVGNRCDPDENARCAYHTRTLSASSAASRRIDASLPGTIA